MNEVPSTGIDGWVHDEIQGELIETGPGTADTEIPFAVPDIGSFPPSRAALHRVSPNHARSFETVPSVHDRALGRIAVWHDRYGNGFTGYSLKGNDVTDPKIIRTNTAANGFIPNGLQDSIALLRVIRGSRLLRENHVDTEWIDRVYEPKYLYHSGERIDQDEYKRRLLDAYDGDDRDDAERALAQSRFFVTGRSMNVNDRLWDFTTDTRDSALARLRHVFTVYNALHTADENYESLDHENDTDRARYFTDVFPYLATRSLARVHGMGLAHVFPYIGNVTALGAVVDLDSLTGEPLGFGDDPISTDNRVRDVFEFSSFGHDLTDKYYNRMYRHLAGLGLASHNHYIRTLDAIGRYYEEHAASSRTDKAPARERLMLAPVSSSHWPRINNGLLEMVGHERFEPYMMKSIDKIEAAAIKSISGEHLFFNMITSIDRIMERECILGPKTIPESLCEELDDDGGHWIEKILMVRDNDLIAIADETLEEAGMTNVVFALTLDEDRRQLFKYLSQSGFWHIWKDLKFNSDEGREGLSILGAEMKSIVASEANFIKTYYDHITAPYLETISGYDRLADKPSVNYDTFHRLRRVGISLTTPEIFGRIAEGLDVTIDILNDRLDPTRPPVIAGRACPRVIFTDSTQFHAIAGPDDDNFVALKVTTLSDTTSYCGWITEPLEDGDKPCLHILGTTDYVSRRT